MPRTPHLALRNPQPVPVSFHHHRDPMTGIIQVPLWIPTWQKHRLTDSLIISGPSPNFIVSAPRQPDFSLEMLPGLLVSRRIELTVLPCHPEIHRTCNGLNCSVTDPCMSANAQGVAERDHRTRLGVGNQGLDWHGFNDAHLIFRDDGPRRNRLTWQTI